MENSPVPTAIQAGLKIWAAIVLLGTILYSIAMVMYGSNSFDSVSYTHLRAHETVLDLVCRLLLEKKTL